MEIAGIVKMCPKRVRFLRKFRLHFFASPYSLFSQTTTKNFSVKTVFKFRNKNYFLIFPFSQTFYSQRLKLTVCTIVLNQPLCKISFMNSEINNETLSAETRQQLKDLSKSFLRLHKILLEGEKAEYEKVNGTIESPNRYLALVLDDPHFSWLRRMSSLIALIDEAASIRRPASEITAGALLSEAKALLTFSDTDENFNDKFQTALQRNSDASLTLNDTLNILRNV